MDGAASVGAAEAPAGLASLRPLLSRICDLKRVESQRVSIAEAGFRQAWGWLAAGVPVSRVARWTAARAVAATVLGPIGPGSLRGAGVSEDDLSSIFRRALAEAGQDTRADALPEALAEPDPAPLAFVERLAQEPRAGATAPGKARIVLTPAESHADHCWAVAVFGALMLPDDPDAAADAFLLGLAHHLHNAWLPDGGFAGEMALGPHLGPVMRAAEARALDELDPDLRRPVERLLAGREGLDTPALAAHHAADAIDRVLQIASYEAQAAFRLSQAVDDLELVHAGPLKTFQDRALAAAGIV